MNYQRIEKNWQNIEIIGIIGKIGITIRKIGNNNVIGEEETGGEEANGEGEDGEEEESESSADEDGETDDDERALGNKE